MANMTIGQRIRERRKELGLSQEELAKRLGNKSRASVCTVEKDKEDLTTTRIRQYAEALETTPAYLMGWEEQLEQARKQIEPYTKHLAEYSKRLKENIGLINVPSNVKYDLAEEFAVLSAEYEQKDIERALKFIKAFLSASPERQRIVLDILKTRQEAP